MTDFQSYAFADLRSSNICGNSSPLTVIGIVKALSVGKRGQSVSKSI